MQEHATRNQSATPPLRATPEQVAADPMLREAARTLADLYLCDQYLTRWLAGEDYTPLPRREFIADLIDADHVLDPDPHDPDGPWLIDRPWRDAPQDAVPSVT